jgi:uncharacterized heparinase superfamily protein
MAKLLIYFHTIKYLKFRQIYHRVLKRFSHPKIHEVEATKSTAKGNWVSKGLYSQRIFSETDVEFLNHKGVIKSAADWNSNSQEKLWLYNLHYFDELNSFGSLERRSLHRYWIHKWVEENAADDKGNGWEAYTLSLRIVNWIKAFQSGLEANDEALNSLAQQADFLSQDLEKHLMGNHYFVNLKALIFAGCFLEGKEADRWIMIAISEYEVELKEQVLADGGSFELTPMYHAIMLTDLLDLYNLFNLYPDKVPSRVVVLTKQTIVKMFGWLHIMSLGDDKVSFFNDSAFGIAPDNETLRTYASLLGIQTNKLNIPEETLIVHNLQNSGYVSCKTSEMTLIADLAPVGPSYIPGHAHADSLAFELSLGEERVFVNSGTSLYGMCAERLRQRGTPAHNTVEINGKNSSEVWSGFRVARRANIIDRNVGEVLADQTVNFCAGHDGYKKQGINCIHHRTWSLTPSSCQVLDELKGNFESAIGFLHLHPSIKIISSSQNYCILNSEQYIVELEVNGAMLEMEKSTWHPAFGVVENSNKLVFKYLQSKVDYKIKWRKL